MAEKVEKVVKTYKMEPETARKLQAVAEAAGLSWDETFRALVGLYEQNKAGEKQPAHKAEIADFRSHLNALQEGYNHLLSVLDNAEERVREEFVARLAASEAALVAMKENVKNAEAERDAKVAEADAMIRTANETAIDDQKQIEDLQKQLDEARKGVADKEALTVSLQAQIAQLQEKLQEFGNVVQKADEVHQRNEALQKQVAEMAKRADDAEAEAERLKAEAQDNVKVHEQELVQIRKQLEFEKRSAVLEAQESAQAKVEKLTAKYTHQLERALKMAQTQDAQKESAEHKMEHDIGQTVLPDMDE